MTVFSKQGGASRGFAAVLGALVFGGLACCSSQPVKAAGELEAKPALRQRTLLDADWRFHRGDVLSSNEVVSAKYDDGRWQRVYLPHDYVLDASGHYSSTNARNHGYLPVEMAWYRKHFFVPQADTGKALRLEFEGVFRDSQVWLNGQFLGRHPSGYTPFQYDISKIARCGRENVITVRVDPREFEGWWYEGGGIYRHVYYTAKDPLHVATWGTHVIPELTEGNPNADAELTVKTRVKNDGSAPAQCEVISEIIGPEGTPLKTLKEAQVIPGRGLKARVEGRDCLLGNEALFGEYGIALPEVAPPEPGATRLWMAVDGKTVTYFDARDALRADAADAVAALRRLGLRVLMLTGDTAGAAAPIAREAGIDEVEAGLDPMGKLERIRSLQKSGLRVAMVGDGINDAAALAQADAGLAMGAGADLAQEAGDVLLVRGQPSAIPAALELARATLGVMRQNLGWAVGYNIVGIPLAAGALYPEFHILLSPWLAAAAMAMSSVCVLGNSLRLRRWRASSPVLSR